MYCSFFGFREKPFTITPNPRFIFLSKNHKDAFAHLLYGIDNHAGFIELSGEVGTGKTTALRTLLYQLDTDSYRTALIFNPYLSALELLQNINYEYGIPCNDQSSAPLLHSLNQFLLEQNAAGRTVVLVIDEAQNLETKVLEQIRLISNLETEKDKLIQIVLAGQPELREKLKKPELRQLNQRITVRYHLCPMDFDDTVEYIEHRLEVAAGRNVEIFSTGALKRVFRCTAGLPRLINAVCDRALLIAYTKEKREVTARMVDEAFRDVRKQESRARLSRILRYAIAAVAVVIVTACWYAFFGGLSGPGDISASTPGTVTASQPSSPPSAGTLATRLAAKTENESAVAAFNTIARIWGVEPIPVDQSPAGRARLEDYAEQSGLELSRNSSNLGALLRMDFPAILELSLPDGKGRRYLALLGMEGDRLIVAPEINERTTVNSTELEKLWFGRSYLPWKNRLNLPLVSRAGDSGKTISDIKHLLAKAGYFKGQPTEDFDEAMEAAVRAFQAAQGIEVDGVVGGQTLLLLYRAGGTAATPRLAKKGES